MLNARLLALVVTFRLLGQLVERLFGQRPALVEYDEPEPFLAAVGVADDVFEHGAGELHVLRVARSERFGVAGCVDEIPEGFEQVLVRVLLALVAPHVFHHRADVEAVQAYEVDAFDARMLRVVPGMVHMAGVRGAHSACSQSQETPFPLVMQETRFPLLSLTW